MEITDNKIEVNIFFSWQSDKKGYANTIRKGLTKAKDDLLKEEIILNLVEATNKEVGSPSITDLIYDKINEADFFVSDISITGNDKELDKYYPNSNVMLETGYALARLGENRVILFFNKNSGQDIHLPFDIRNNRYKPFSKDTNDKTENRDKIAEWIKLMIIPFKKTNSLKAGLIMSDMEKENYKLSLSLRLDVINEITKVKTYMSSFHTGIENEASLEFLNSMIEHMENSSFEANIKLEVLNKMFPTSNNAQFKDKCDDYLYRSDLFKIASEDLIGRKKEGRDRGEQFLVAKEKLDNTFYSSELVYRSISK